VCPVDQEGDEHHATYARDVEAARKALENVTLGGHRCEVYVSKTIGHCPDRASVVTYAWEDGAAVRGALLCPVHKALTLTDAARIPVAEWEVGNGPIRHEDGPIAGERIAPAMAPVRRGGYLSVPIVWGDDWTGYELGMVLAQHVRPGDLVVFAPEGNAYRVKSVDVCPIPYSEPIIRYGCNGGATYGTHENHAVAVLFPRA
jgi:hypothetical protein